MPKKRNSKRHTLTPNGLSEEEIDLSESEDEILKVKGATLPSLLIDETSSSSEEIDAEEVTRATSTISKREKNVSWRKKDFVSPSANFTGNLPLPPDGKLEPINYFYSMFGKELLSLLTDQSNLYAIQTNSNKPLCLSYNEMDNFIGVLIMMGVYLFPTQRFFWMHGTRVDSICSVMSRDRFFQIKQNLHCVDNSVQLYINDPKFDRAHKVRPLLNIVKENFRKIVKEEKLSADEQIIPFKGRSIMKQHMPLKPNRWGYKMFVLAGGESGIYYDFIFYTGKGEKSEHCFCTKIVLELCETVPRRINHKLYCDNYYTTIALQVELHKLGIFTVGTVRSNRLPGLVMKTEKEFAKEGRGSMDYRVAEVDGIQICATRWYDNGVVNCLSTLYACLPVDLVQRWSTKEKKHVEIMRPNVVAAYNQHMGGVDLLDMLISLYRIEVRSKKYYMKIIFHLIDLCVVNAWLLYRRHCAQINTPKKQIMSLLTFRINIAEALLKSSPPSPPAPSRGRPRLDTPTSNSNSTTTPRATPNSMPSRAVRFDKYDHWLTSTEKGRCRNPECTGYIRISCSKCLIRLCLNERNNCFKNYRIQ